MREEKKLYFLPNLYLALGTSEFSAAIPFMDRK